MQSVQPQNIPCMGSLNWHLTAMHPARGPEAGPSRSATHTPCSSSPEEHVGNSFDPFDFHYEPFNDPPASNHSVPCDPGGWLLPDSTPPLPHNCPPSDNYLPFTSEQHFQLTNFLFRKEQMSGGNIDELMQILAAFTPDHVALFMDSDDVYATIDNITLADMPWFAFKVSYKGPLPDGEVPKWMTEKFTVWFRDPPKVLHQQLGNQDICLDEIDWTAKHVFNQKGQHVYENVMSADWAWQQADTIAADLKTHGSAFCSIVLGSDKTTMSVATGQNDYWPLVQQNTVSLLAFLAIPKKYENDAAFRKFHRELFHDSLHYISNHYCQVISGLGPYIADYPEQTLLACTVQKWFLRCTAHRDKLDGHVVPRSPEHTAAFHRGLNPKKLWNDYGIVGDLDPFTSDFPHTNIHEFFAPDLLRQVIKETFKDHLHGKSGAAQIMADIDWRIAVTSPFPGLRRFPEGRKFKQWTGNDFKALMKVFLPAVAGYIPSKMVQALSAILDFCYLVRQPAITSADLLKIEAALLHFHEKHVIFEETGVHLIGFSLACQHALGHFPRLIQLFVKKPWTHSNRYEVLGQMLLTKQRLNKLAAIWVDFTARGMLQGNICHVCQTLFFLLFHTNFSKSRTILSLIISLFQVLILMFSSFSCCSAIARYFAPNGQSSPEGISWRNGPSRWDCTFIVTDPSKPGSRGLEVVRIHLLFSMCAAGCISYFCALASQFLPINTGMWMMEPELDDDGHPILFVLSTEKILYTAHLIENFWRSDCS
ncbi:hypothetical protein BV20DRAFT_1039932 [Pilatotrama ljubarskyi]|nr:hypothetical protein BV20DRAFT_1039932 [Pilatotrama ljubarskyi]